MDILGNSDSPAIVAVSIIVAVCSFAIAMVAAGIAFWQGWLQKKALDLQTQANQAASELQTLTTFWSISNDVDYSKGIDLIASMTSTTAEGFNHEFDATQRKSIFETIRFLNQVAIFEARGHVRRQTIWDIYFVAYRMVGQKLSPWWFGMVRQSHHNRFRAIERMAGIVCDISDEEIERFDDQYR